ncbi:MAG: hypothetical protein LUO80_07975, partial [Methylococcaceae bacterium]|nr:hypothetical protein [Methylococcaceae bacterium]
MPTFLLLLAFWPLFPEHWFPVMRVGIYSPHNQKKLSVINLLRGKLTMTILHRASAEVLGTFWLVF